VPASRHYRLPLILAIIGIVQFAAFLKAAGRLATEDS
jgi:hypothetical protein